MSSRPARNQPGLVGQKETVMFLIQKDSKVNPLIIWINPPGLNAELTPTKARELSEQLKMVANCAEETKSMIEVSTRIHSPHASRCALCRQAHQPNMLPQAMHVAASLMAFSQRPPHRVCQHQPDRPGRFFRRDRITGPLCDTSLRDALTLAFT